MFAKCRVGNQADPHQGGIYFLIFLRHQLKGIVLHQALTKNSKVVGVTVFDLFTRRTIEMCIRSNKHELSAASPCNFSVVHILASRKSKDGNQSLSRSAVHPCACTPLSMRTRSSPACAASPYNFSFPGSCSHIADLVFPSRQVILDFKRAYSCDAVQS